MACIRRPQILTCAVVAIFALRGALAFSQESQAEAAPAQSDAKSLARQFDEEVRPFLVRHCFACHGALKPKGNLSLEKLARDFSGREAREKWLAVKEKIERGEMPPKSKPRPPENEVRVLADWIRGQVDSAMAARRAAQGRVVLRRLNRVEYEAGT